MLCANYTSHSIRVNNEMCALAKTCKCFVVQVIMVSVIFFVDLGLTE